jgi:3-phosphoshikimate 1-carboxyvinyltransferase
MVELEHALEAVEARIPFGCAVSGRVRVPPSKSFSHRYLVSALLARKPLEIENLLEADDLRLFLTALDGLGFTVERRGDIWRVAPPSETPPAGTVLCGNAGTMFRFLTAVLTTVPGRWTLDGTARLRERPVGALVRCLRSLGAVIECPVREGFAPLEIVGGSLHGGSADLDAGESSQYLSAVLLAAVRAREPVRVRVSALASSPYLEITLAVLEAFAVPLRVDRQELVFEVEAGVVSPPPRVTVEADYSAATYPAVAALIAGGSVELEGLRADSPQGDRAFFDLLEAAGGRVEWRDAVLSVSAEAPLRALDVDMGGMPDQVPTLAALAPFLAGTTVIRNVAHLRIKESDRLSATATELARLGVPVEEREDALVVQGCWHEAPPPMQPVAVDTYDDHRIAMSMALVGLRRQGVTIRDPGVVAKSYPNFWRDLSTLLG